MNRVSCIATLMVSIGAGCSKTDGAASDSIEAISETLNPTDPATSCAEDDGVILETPEAYSEHIECGFDRYAEVVAPNGKPIRIFIQDGVSDTQAHRARNVLRFFLTNA